jgi:hypothetical protein
LLLVLEESGWRKLLLLVLGLGLQRRVPLLRRLLLLLLLLLLILLLLLLLSLLQSFLLLLAISISFDLGEQVGRMHELLGLLLLRLPARG